MGLHPLIIVDVKSTRNKNWIRPFDECKMWITSLPATSIMGLQPLIIVDVKSTININNGFTAFDYCGCQVYYKHR